MEKPTSSTLSYLTGLSVSAFSISFNEMIALAGLAIAAATFLINWRYKHLHYLLDKRARDVSENPSD